MQMFIIWIDRRFFYISFLKKEKNTSKKRQNKSVQKKKEEILGFKLFVIIVFKPVKAPIVQAPLSPKKILALGKLNSKKDNKIII